MQKQVLPPSRLFWRLAVTTACLTFALVIVGAVVRVTDSGLGCGSAWPLCNGTVIPPFDNVQAWIEWSHRLIAMSIGVFGIAMLVVAIRRYRTDNKLVLGMTVFAAVLYAIQSDLGRQVVKADLSPALVAIHLGTAMLLLAALLSAAVMARYNPDERYRRDSITTLIYVGAFTALLIILTGALVRGSGANLACTDWPLCNGELLPTSRGDLATIHMIHRFAVAALGVTLTLMVWQVFRSRRNAVIRRLAGLALASYFTQAAIGALFVVSKAAGIWGAGHVAFAALTWALLIALSVMETLNTRESLQQVAQRSIESPA